MSAQDQVEALLALQGECAEEAALLSPGVSDYVENPARGANESFAVALDNGGQAFHKTFKGVNEQTAAGHNHHPDQVPLNECLAWRVADLLGDPVRRLVAPTVLWDYGGEPGALIAALPGSGPASLATTEGFEDARAAAFFDSLIAQQDRHDANGRWDPTTEALGLFDHGYAFALAGHTCGSTVFVTWRWSLGPEAQCLTRWETDALGRLLDGPLDVVRPAMLDARADALEDRARRMLAAASILAPGQF